MTVIEVENVRVIKHWEHDGEGAPSAELTSNYFITGSYVGELS